MNKSIMSINQQIDKIIKQMSALQQKNDDQSNLLIAELRSNLDNLIAEKNNISQEYLNLIEDSISNLKYSELKNIIEEYNVSEEEARTILYNSIMSNNGSDLESYYKTITYFRENNIGETDFRKFKSYLLKYKEIRLQIASELKKFKNRKKTELSENAETKKKISEIKEKRKTYLDIINGLSQIVSMIGSKEAEKLKNDFLKESKKYDDLDSKSLNMTIDMLPLKKEKFPLNLFHKSKLAAKREKIDEILNEQETQLEKVCESENKIKTKAENIWHSISKDTQAQIIFHAISNNFSNSDSVIKLIIQSIKTGSTTQIDYYISCLKEQVYQFTHEINQLKEQEQKTQHIVDEINKLQENPTCFSDIIHINTENKVAYKIITDEYPFVNDLSLEEIDSILITKLNSTNICLIPNKGKEKSRTTEKK